MNSLVIKKTNIPEYIVFSRMLITLNTALIGGIFFKLAGKNADILIASAAALFALSTFFSLAFFTALIEHKDFLVESIIDAGYSEKPEHIPIFGAISFALAMLLLLIGLSLLCISLF